MVSGRGLVINLRRAGTKEHKGRFGHMGECLDCLEELKKGRCTIDVTQFDYRWYWQVRRFWDQVDIKGEDECWPWLGGTKKNGLESVEPTGFYLRSKDIERKIKVLEDKIELKGPELANYVEEVVSELLSNLFDRDQLFEQTQDLKRCKYCDFAGVCQRATQDN